MLAKWVPFKPHSYDMKTQYVTLIQCYTVTVHYNAIFKELCLRPSQLEKYNFNQLIDYTHCVCNRHQA